MSKEKLYVSRFVIQTDYGTFKGSKQIYNQDQLDSTLEWIERAANDELRHLSIKRKSDKIFFPEAILKTAIIQLKYKPKKWYHGKGSKN